MRAKYNEIVELIKKRVDDGYYLTVRFPGERSLAYEFGVSYMTGRRAIQQLTKDKVLCRQENGRVCVVDTKMPTFAKLKVDLLVPAYISPSINKWWMALRNIVSQRDGQVRMIHYLDWNDPVIWETINNDTDYVFLIPPHGMPKLLEERLAQKKDKIITLFSDLTRLGLSGVDGGAAQNISKLIEHLSEMGHKSVDFLNTEPGGAKLNQFIETWRAALKRLGLQGTLHNDQVQPFSNPETHAYHTIIMLLKRKQLTSTAVFCSTVAVARGTMRALHDKKIKIGSDIAVCSFGCGEQAEMMIPSLTVVDTPDPMPILSQALELFCKSKSKPQFIQPKNVRLFIGESSQRLY